MYTLTNCYYNEDSMTYEVRVKPHVLLSISIPTENDPTALKDIASLYMSTHATLPEEAWFVKTGVDSQGREIFDISFDMPLLVDYHSRIENISMVIGLTLTDPHARQRKINHLFAA